MYSLHDITSVCPKIEPVDSDEGETNEQGDMDRLHSQAKSSVEDFPINNNTVHGKVNEYDTTLKGNRTSLERLSTNSLAPYNNVSTTQSGDLFPSKHITVTYSTANNTTVSMDTPEIQIGNAFTVVPIYEINGREGQYYPVSVAENSHDIQNGTQHTYRNNNSKNKTYGKTFLQQNGGPEGLPAYRSNFYGKMPYALVASSVGLSPYQGLPTYSGTHRALTAHEMGVQVKPCCQCPCHLQLPPPSHMGAVDMKSQRPSVIMVPAKLDQAFVGANSKVKLFCVNIALNYISSHVR